MRRGGWTRDPGAGTRLVLGERGRGRARDNVDSTSGVRRDPLPSTLTLGKNITLIFVRAFRGGVPVNPRS